MVQFIPGYRYSNGDTLCVIDNGKKTYYHNAFGLTCLSTNQAHIFANGQYNSALMESSETTVSTTNINDSCYTPSLYLMPEWDYYLHYNTHPTAAYVETTHANCGIPSIWNGLHISQDGDYRQIFQTTSGLDSVVVLHLTLDNNIGTIGEIHGTNQIDSLGYYDFYIDPVEHASFYQWELQSPKWQLQSDSLQSRLAVTERSSGTIIATALSERGICRSSSQIHLKLCDEMGEVSEIQGLSNIIQNGVYFYYIDSVDKATSYLWKVFHDGWEISGDSNKTSVLLQISQSGTDCLYLTVTDECGYTTNRSLLIQSEVGVANYKNGQTSVLLFPNPANEEVTLLISHTSTATENFEITLTDASGRCLQNKKMEGSYTFPLHDYASGVYFIRVSANNIEPQVLKFIKK